MSAVSSNTENDADGVAEFRAAVAAIQHHNRKHGRPADAVSGQTSPGWLEQAAGLYKNSEVFEEATRSGEEWRNADTPKAEG